MTKEEFTEKYLIEPDVIFIGNDSEWGLYEESIMGISQDGNHVIYSYEKLVNCLASHFCKNGCEDYEDYEDYLEQAKDWVEFNTIRSLLYLNQKYVPIIVYEI